MTYLADDPNLWPVSDASCLSDYLADGYSVEDYLHDNAVECEDCRRRFSSLCDGVYSERYDVWVCEECFEVTAEAHGDPW